MIRPIRQLALGLATVALGACASAGTPGNATVQHNVVTAAELAPMKNLTLLDALQRIRPIWFRSRNATNMCNPCNATVGEGASAGGQTYSPTNTGTEVHFYINGQRTSGPQDLRMVPISTVQEVRFYEPQDADTRFGTGNEGGAVNVVLKP